ncbi:MAG: gas vesicle protein [Phycisphaerae bacterium]|nr:gas vesicle protein [Phycisphaerae bacterium]
MEPELPKYNRATLVDLLDRILDKGVFLRADVVISVAGIPLIGLTLSVVLAGMETMLEYGLLSDWDQAIRALPPGQRYATTTGGRPTEPRPGKRVASAVPA